MIDISRDIVEQAARGERKAFEEIYKACSGFVYAIAYRVTNNKSDAEEITQDVFVQIYKNLKNFRFKSSFKTWVYRITVNTSINRYRSSSRENSRKQEYENAANLGQVTSENPEFIDRESSEKRVASILSPLGPEQRACIILREIEGLDYKEISQALKININTVRSRLRRARQALQEAAKRTKGSP